MIFYLIGYMGSGKSTVGKKIAANLKWNFIDLDSEIESRYKLSISSIFADKGEDYFRKIEAEVLRNINPSTNTIISCGGGTPCYQGNMDFMNKRGFTVYLKMTPAALRSRLRVSRDKRPLIANLSDDELLSFLTASIQEREKWYNQSRMVMEGLNADIKQLSSLFQSQNL